MSRETTKQKSATGRFTQTMGTAAKILGGANIPAFTLRYLSSDSLHKQGDFETILVPYAKLGRSSNCAVRFGDEYPTVSREHAQIERVDATTILIKQLSQNNPTLVNGKPVKNEWYLNNGDVIQLSMEGPRLLFNISPTGTASMKFTDKFNNLMKQAVKPYRTAIITLVLFFAASISALSYYFIGQTNKLAQDLDDSNKSHAKMVDSLKVVYENKIKDIKSELQKIKKIPNRGGGTSTIKNPVPNAIPTDIKDQVYFLKVKNIRLEVEGTSKDVEGGWTGTGFLLNDGKFVTARHCIQGWRFIKSTDEEAYVLMNIVENNGGRIVIDFEAISSSGNKLTFQYDSSSKTGFTLNDSSDDVKDLGNGGVIKLAYPNANDWAVITGYNLNGNKSSIQSLNEMAMNPKVGTPVHILGFSYGQKLQDRTPNPLYSDSKIAKDGLTEGLIILTDRNFGPGNSGGPVFFFDTEANTYKVIGIVSAGIGSEIGIIVPISQIQ